MTAQQIFTKFNGLFADNNSGQISEADLREFNKDLTDFLGASTEEVIPLWSAGLVFNTNGTGDGDLCRFADSGGNIRLWQTKTSGNTGNQPPSAPGTTENTHWLEVSASSGSALVEWTAGVYGAGLVIVFWADTLRKLNAASRPYTSTNIDTETANGDWVIVGGGGGTAATTTYDATGENAGNLPASATELQSAVEEARMWINNPETPLGAIGTIVINKTGVFNDVTIYTDTVFNFATSGHIAGNGQLILISTAGGFTVTFNEPNGINLYIPADFANGAVLAAGVYLFAFMYVGGSIKVNYLKMQTTSSLTPLTAPTISSTVAGFQQVEVVITNLNSGNEDSNLIQYKLSSSGTWIDGVSIASGGSSGIQTGLTNGSQYDFRVIAKGSSPYADSSPSQIAQQTPADVAIALQSITIENAAKTIVSVNYNKTLDTGSVPASTDFSLGTKKSIIAVSISGTKVLIETSDYGYGDVENLTYVKGANPIQDASSNDAAAFAFTDVTNNIISTGDIISIGGILAYFNASDIDGDGTNNSAYSNNANLTQWSDKGLLGNDGIQDSTDYPIYKTETIIGYGNKVINFPTSPANFITAADMTIPRFAGCVVFAGSMGANIYPLLKDSSKYLRVDSNTAIRLAGISPVAPIITLSEGISGSILFINFESNGIKVYKNRGTTPIGQDTTTVLTTDFLIKIIGGETGIDYSGLISGCVLFNKALTLAQRINICDEFQSTLKYPLPQIIDPIASIANCQMYVDTYFDTQMYLDGSDNLVEWQDQARARQGTPTGLIPYDSVNKRFDHAAALTKLNFTSISLTGNNYTVIAAINGGGGKMLWASGTSNYFWLSPYYDMNGVLATVDATAATWDDDCIVTFRGNATNRIMRQNKVQIRSGAAVATARAITSFGSTYVAERFNGKLYAMAIFNRALTDTEIVTVEDLLNSRHGGIFF